jgi:Spy/CpxP family protein refolding chaperone
MTMMRRLALAALAGAVLIAASSARAGEPKKDGYERGHWDRFEALKKKLDLSDNQVSKLKEAQKSAGQDARVLKDRTEADVAALRVLVDEKASEAELNAGLEALEKDHKAMQERSAKTLERYRSVLTPLQQAKFVLWWSAKGGKRGSDGAWGLEQGPGGFRSGAQCGGGAMHRGKDQGPDSWNGEGDPAGEGMKP